MLFIAHRYNNEVKHIRIFTRESFFHIAENRKFRSLMVSKSFDSFPQRHLRSYLTSNIIFKRGDSLGTVEKNILPEQCE